MSESRVTCNLHVTIPLIKVNNVSLILIKVKELAFYKRKTIDFNSLILNKENSFNLIAKTFIKLFINNIKPSLAAF
jgi:hypothetical protein